MSPLLESVNPVGCGISLKGLRKGQRGIVLIIEVGDIKVLFKTHANYFVNGKRRENCMDEFQSPTHH